MEVIEIVKKKKIEKGKKKKKYRPPDLSITWH